MAHGTVCLGQEEFGKEQSGKVYSAYCHPEDIHMIVEDSNDSVIVPPLQELSAFQTIQELSDVNLPVKESSALN